MRNSEGRRLKLYRGWWYVVWREDGKTQRSSLRTRDRAQAERNFQIHVNAEASAPETISEILDKWAEDKSHLKSIDIAKAKMRPVKEFFGNLKPEHINKKLCKES